ncbi:uncharacterized protein C8Q71DRAFT_885557 [Rhodofomes roseus]|uniref:Uncharacterized protein n=1 Tax=Rhodofomes roseus TaxID=34475 RepID=A0ABQ8KTG0_9APHY|nr:uncharacterized protein C8Q71DRAFT_885557 [Rhodofomes roseus]KAH9841997.1 hypothetical protein C8Q71DRAFT_885557 [Rhodofomes roseus]
MPSGSRCGIHHYHRVDSRSPASIPLSLTSGQSASSAIFERNIERITSAALLPTADPQRVSRGRYTEQLEQSVPSVLDSAAAILAAPDSQYDDFDGVSIITPAPPDSGYHSGFASPSSRCGRENRPSAGSTRGVIILSLISSCSHRTQAQSPAPIAPVPTVPGTLTSAYYSASAMPSEASSPTTATHHAHPLRSLPTSPAPTSFPNSPAAPQPMIITILAPLVSHPPSHKAAAKRLPFLSYMVLLSSTPPALFRYPPVIGLTQALYAASSSAGSVHAASVMEQDIASEIVDDVGGEWEHKGLRRGLEERLKVLNSSSPPVMPAISGRA